MKHLLESAMTREVADYEMRCPECHKVFGVTETEQRAGCRDLDYIICPYCHWESDRKSMRVEFDCYKIDEVNNA